MQLISTGINVNAKRYKDGKTALLCASARGHCNIVQLLIHHKADASIEDNEGFTALTIALFNNKNTVVELLEPVFGVVSSF